MKIDEIEYAIRLFVMTDENNCISEELFSDFKELNEYIRQTYTLDKYGDVTGEIMFVEVVDGVAENSGK